MIPDWSPGDVIHADDDGTIILDDGITTWNPIRARAFLGKSERRDCAMANEHEPHEWMWDGSVMFCDREAP